jgi:DNA-binding transcriptional LysR family regulator
LSYVRAGLGVTVMPDCFDEPGVVRVHLEGFDFTRDIGLVFAPHADPLDLAQSDTIAALIAAVLPHNA